MQQDGKPERLGFFTTIFVEAVTEQSAEERAVQLIREDRHLRDKVLNNQKDPPMVFAEEIERVEAFPDTVLNKGYTFFLYSGDEGPSC